MTYVEDIANTEWRLKRATRWEQAIGRKDNTTAIAEKALKSGTEKLGISSEHAAEGSRGWRCNELRFSLTRERDTKAQSSFIDDPDGVELTATLTDPVGDLNIVLRYQHAIRRDRDNAVDRLLKLQRVRARIKERRN